MEFISTKGMTPENAPDCSVLVQYLEPSFGFWYVEFGIGYFDDKQGWKHWNTEQKINVIAYAIFPEALKSELTNLKQKEFLAKFGSYHPDLGCIGS